MFCRAFLLSMHMPPFFLFLSSSWRPRLVALSSHVPLLLHFAKHSLSFSLQFVAVSPRHSSGHTVPTLCLISLFSFLLVAPTIPVLLLSLALRAPCRSCSSSLVVLLKSFHSYRQYCSFLLLFHTQSPHQNAAHEVIFILINDACEESVCSSHLSVSLSLVLCFSLKLDLLSSSLCY